MSDLVEKRRDAQTVPRNLPPTRGDFAQSWGGFRPVGRRGEGCRIGEGQSQSESHLVKPRANAERRSSARGGGQWCVWVRYDADKCAFKQFKKNGDGQGFFRYSENWTKFLEVISNQHVATGAARGPTWSRQVQVKNFPGGAPYPRMESVLPKRRVPLDFCNFLSAFGLLPGMIR